MLKNSTSPIQRLVLGRILRNIELADSWSHAVTDQSLGQAFMDLKCKLEQPLLSDSELSLIRVVLAKAKTAGSCRGVSAKSHKQQ